MREVLINAYPKSGTTWLLHLICDLLEGVHQDTPEMESLTYDHPVTSDWVIRKTHYPYWSEAIPYVEDKVIILTQRDPRDIVVSAMHYRKTNDLDAAINQLEKSSYIGWVNSWLDPVEPLKVGKLMTTRYEYLHWHPILELTRIANALGEYPTPERVQEAVDRQSFPNMLRQLGNDHHFMRKGIVGDWRNHFNREQAKYFNIHFGQFMLGQNYIDSLDWWKNV